VTEFKETDYKTDAEKMVEEQTRWSRRALIEAAMTGETMREVLVVGGAVVPDGITRESIALVRDELIQQGVIALNPDYTARLTDKGEAELMNGLIYNREPGI
jgi:hypothetical protein